MNSISLKKKNRIAFGLFLIIFLISFQNLSAQTKLITGVVVDGDGDPIPGVTVLQINSENATITSIEGKYALGDLSENDTIQFSYIGYNIEYKVVGDQRVIDIIMSESEEMLDEVQIIAFQEQKKESVIGSINTINPKELKIAPSNLTSAFAGRLAGVISYQRSGEPGQDNAEFFVRGVTTFGYKNDPLILIDGLEVTSNDLARIEPDNIASFSIMKDATATALYGARGANGVILVTTKEGKKGKARISFRFDNSLSTPTMTNDFLDGVEYMELYNQASRSRNPEELAIYSKYKIENTRNGGDPYIFPNVNWYNELFRDYVFNQKANMNINGGGEIAQYYLSVSYINEKGLLKVDPLNNFNNNIDINRYNLRANVKINLTKTTKAFVKFYSLFDRYNGPVNEANSIFESVMQANPVNFPMYYEKDEDSQFINHTLFGNKSPGSFPNPYADMVSGYKDRFTSTILSQFQIEQDLSFITKGLKIRGMGSVRTYSSNENSRSFDPYYYGINEIETESGVYNVLYPLVDGTEYLNDPVISNNANSSFYFEIITQYNRTFNKRHDIGALLVFMRKESLNTIVGDNAYATLPSRNMGLSGRLTYGYGSRYFLELNFGYNGSEKFAEDNRFGFFPSAGIGWNVSNEPFFMPLKDVVTKLKFKATYGFVGNDAISAADDRFFYLSDANLNDGGRSYNFGNDFNIYYPGYTINRYANPNVTWEIAEKTNFGLELGLFNKFDLQIDYFTEHRTNIYMKREYIPVTMGLLTDTVNSNIGEAGSHGFDASLDYSHVINSKFWISVRGNFTYATNEFIVNGEPVYEYDYLSRIGHPINQEWGWVADRLFIDQSDVDNSPDQFNLRESDEGYLPGDIKYVDINGDGVIDLSDRVPIGFPTVPEIIYGAGLSTGYKNFDFSFFVQGLGRESFFIDQESMSPFIDERNALLIITDNHWSDDNPDPNAFWPRLSVLPVENNNKQSTWWLRDGSFLRLKSVELGYSISKNALKRLRFKEVRIYVSGTNLLTLSKFKLWDPEMAGKGMGYPPQKLYNIGIKITI